LEARCRVLIADDHAIVRNAVRTIFATIDGVEIVGEAEDGMQAVALAKRIKPDVLLLDVAMPQMGGLAAIGEIKRWSPETRVVIFTGIDRAMTLNELRASGAVGVLLKSCTPQEIADGLSAVIAGQEYIAKGVRELLESGGPMGELTTRERQILSLVAQGKTNAEIAELLHISPKTADNHRTNLMRKLDVHSTAELLAVALREGMLDT
jgi:DNA-binding NarL/FixJ family response regulator